MSLRDGSHFYVGFFFLFAVPDRSEGRLQPLGGVPLRSRNFQVADVYANRHLYKTGKLITSSEAVETEEEEPPADILEDEPEVVREVLKEVAISDWQPRVDNSENEFSAGRLIVNPPDVLCNLLAGDRLFILSKHEVVVKKRALEVLQAAVDEVTAGLPLKRRRLGNEPAGELPVPDIKEGQTHCTVCVKDFGSMAILKKHVERFHLKKTFPCAHSGCFQIFPSESKRSQHFAVVHEKTQLDFACQFCGRKFSNKSSVGTHEKKECPQKVVTTGYPCANKDKGCEYVARVKRYLNEHIKRCPYEESSQELPCLCPPCTKVFQSKRARDAHVRQVHKMAF